MKTLHRRLHKPAPASTIVAGITLGIFSAVLLAGVSVQAVSTNYIWNVSSDVYTNDVNWIAQTNGVTIGNAAPCGSAPISLAAGGSVNYFALVTNGGAISYGDGGGGPSGPYSWTNVLGQLTVGGAANGAVTMSSGSLIVSNAGGNEFMLGGAAPGAGSFTLNGGSLTAIRDASTFFQDFLIVGNALNASGTLTINGGVLTCLGGIEVGNGGAGTITVNNGVLVDNGWFGIGRGAAANNSSGTFNLSGGIVYILRNQGNDTSGADNGLYLGQGATNLSVANISGGTLYCVGIGMGGGGAQSTQGLNISGGTIYIGYRGFSTGTGAKFANISGGTIRTLNTVTNNAANMGATNSSTILTDGTNWTWVAAVPVNLTNSSFTVNGSSGPGYITFAPEANKTITLNNPWTGVGGMTLSGPGTIAMATANILGFSGPLTVNGGTLLISAANTFGNPLILNSGILALSAAQKDTNGLTLNGGNIAILTGGSLADPTITLPAASSFVFSNTSTITFTNVITGAGNVLQAAAGVVNVGNNLQNSGPITINNGILVVNGNILNASSITNNAPASFGPFVAQGNIKSPIGIGTNSAIELGTTALPGTLNASNVTINGTWDVKINTATTPGSGINDLLVCSNLTLGANSVLNVLPLGLPNGSYVIAEYSGTLVTNIGSGFSSVSDSTRTGTYTVSFATPGEVILNVGAVTPASLTWATPLIGGSNQWDVAITTNWLNAGSLDMFHQQDAVTFSNTPSPTLTNRVVVAATVYPSSVTISGGLPYIFSGTGHISGGTGITYNDTNTSGFFTFGNDFTGPVNINAGVFQLGSGGSGWFGATNGATTVNGGTLDLDGQAVGAEPLVLQGTGGGMAGTNGGAINNSATTSPSQSGGPLNVTLAGDTTINAAGARWDIGLATLGAGGGSFTGNGHNLVKIGNQAIWMHEVGDIGVGNIDIQQGLLGFEFTIGMGISGDTVTVEPGATLGLFSLNTNSILNKQLVLNNNATLQSGGNAGASNNFVGPITLNGTNAITTSSFPLNLPGVINGTGGYSLTGTGPLYLGSVDTYSGPTVMSANSRLVLNPGASIGNSSLIYMTPSTNILLDAGTNTVTLGSGQTLVGAGSITATNFVANTGATISPGTNLTFGTFVFTNNLTLNGNTNNFKITDTAQPPLLNDFYQVNGNLNLNGVSTINVTPLVGLQPQPYVIMQVNGTITGSAANLHVASLSPRYTMAAQINPPYVEIVPTGVPASLVWKGNLSSLWNYGTSNWFNIGTGQADTFFVGDNPVFDDSSSVNTVTITNGILPAGIFMSNVVKTYTFNGSGIPSGTLTMAGSSGQGGTLVLAMTNAPSFTAIDSQYGNLVFNLQGLTNYTVASTIEDTAFTASGKIIFGGTNTALVTADNYDAGYDGQFLVTNGVLRYTNDDAFSAGFEPIVVANTGTLDFNGVPLSAAFNIHISGVGFNGKGAMFDGVGNAEPNGAFVNLTLDGDAVVGAGARYDQHVPTGSPGQVNGQGFNLTLVGTGALFFNPQADGDTHFGNIDVATTGGGRLAFQGGPLALGLTDHYLFLETNATVTFFSFTNPIDTVHGGVDKIMWMKGSAVLDSGGSSNNYVGPIFLTGTNLIGTRTTITIWNTIMDTNGPGGLILGNDPIGTSGGDLWLNGANSYSGATIISNRTVHVGASSSLGLSTYVSVNSGAALDLSALSSFNFGTVATNQVMVGNGTVVGPATGNININSGGTLAPGLPTANFTANTNTSTLTISNSLVFNSGSTYFVGVNKTSANAATNASDHVVGLTSVTMGGTLVVTNYGRSFVGGDVIPLFSSTTYNAGGFTSNNIVPATPGPNLAWDTSTLGTDGNLRIFSTLVINPNPTNIVVSVSGNQLTLSWPADHTGWTLQSETNNLSVGLTNNWTAVPNSTTVNSMTIPINLTNGTVFFRLIYANP